MVHINPISLFLNTPQIKMVCGNSHHGFVWGVFDIIIYIYIPMDPVVPSERKWDWGIIHYNLEG